MIKAVLVVQLITLLVALYAARKARHADANIRHAHRLIGGVSLTVTQQIEALDGLYHRLGLERGSLPPSRGWAASPDFLNVLYDHIRDHRPSVLVECGSGLTTIVAARCCQQLGKGRLLSLEHDAHYGELTRKHLRALGLDGFVEMCIAPLRSMDINGTSYQWYDLSRIDLPRQIDLVVVDGPPMPITGEQGRYPVGPVLIDRLAPNGAMLFDDANRPGERKLIERILEENPGMTRQNFSAEKGCALIKSSAPQRPTASTLGVEKIRA